MSAPSPADFVALAKFALELLEWVRSLGHDYEMLKARAGVLSLVFSDLHATLLKFTNIPKDREQVFSDLRQSCYATLCQIQPTLDKLERMKSDPRWKRAAKKVIYAAQNEMEKINTEILNQTLLLSHMTIRINQMFDHVASRREHANLTRKVDRLITTLTSLQIEYREATGLQAPRLDLIKEVSGHLKKIAPSREMAFDIIETFGPYIPHHQLMQQPFTGRQPLASDEDEGAWNDSEPSDDESMTLEETPTSAPVDELFGFTDILAGVAAQVVGAAGLLGLWYIGS